MESMQRTTNLCKYFFLGKMKSDFDVGKALFCVADGIVYHGKMERREAKKS